MKRWFAAFGAALLLLPAFSGCGAGKLEETEKPLVVATLFPQYDFACQIAGEEADIVLLLPPGVESHSYEPTPADILRLEKADVFLYTGAEMEPWAERILEGLQNERLLVCDVTAGIALDPSGGEHGEDGHAHQADPHVWTSPVHAQRMTANVAEALSAADPEHAPLYTGNAEAYIQELEALDGRFREMVKNAKRDTIVFAGRFAFHYLFQEYGLHAIAAYDSCSTETEPNARAVAEIIDKIRQDALPAVYYEELVDPQAARSISEETGAEMLLLHSCHNRTREEQEAGWDYLSLMEQNLENLRKGLS